MGFTEVDISLELVDPYAEIMVARLDQIKYDSFAVHESGLKAYILTNLFDKKKLNDIISEISISTQVSFKISRIKKVNWNKEWESNYSPVLINENCIIRAQFHTQTANVKHEIIITPKMSFGTGHHETTFLVMNQIFELDCKGKCVLDVGSGTGVLGILASKLGAKKIIGIDSDIWSYKNSIENARLNNISNIKFINGNADAIGDAKYDIVLANINRNIILNDIEKYVHAMKPSSEIILSGFLKEDKKIIINKIEQLNFNLVDSKNKNKWQMLHLKKG